MLLFPPALRRRARARSNITLSSLPAVPSSLMECWACLVSGAGTIPIPAQGWESQPASTPQLLECSKVTPKPLPCTQAAAAADPHLTLSGGSYLEKDFVSRKMAAGLWGAHSLVAHLPGHQLTDIPEKSPKFDLETGLRVRVQHFTPGRGSSSVLNPLQFPRALRRKTGGWGEA